MNTSKENGQKIIESIRKGWAFVTEDVWKCKSNNLYIHIIKTINLSIRCFLNEMLHQRASALAFQSLLAIVPALVLLLSIGKAFGLGTMIESQLMIAFPAHHNALQYAFSFVELYMEQIHSGIFVGIGVILLLWTLITLMSNIENTVNDLWNVPNRKFARRITDSMALFIILPTLLIASNGMSIFASTILNKLPNFTTLGQHLMQISSYILTWLLFTAAYIILPNVKVKFKHAFVSGIICGTAFNLFQWLYLSGQIWVSKYNAIYGSFAFLPLLMLWMQFSWLICLIGVVLSYSSQNVFNFDYEKDINNISRNYYEHALVTIMSIILNRRHEGKSPLTCYEISQYYKIPIQLVSHVIKDLSQIELVAPTPVENDYAYIATKDSDILTIGYLLNRIDNNGSTNFVDTLGLPQSALHSIHNLCYSEGNKTRIIDLPIPKIEEHSL